MSPKSSMWRSAAVALLVGSAGACGDGGSGAPTPETVTATTPMTQTAVAGTGVAPAPAVRVVDSRGRGVSGVPVNFAVTSGGGTVATAIASTDQQGAASVGSWTLGRTAGANSVTATVAGIAPVTFTATGTAGAPALLAKVSGEPQTAAAGTALPQPFVIRVTDANGNPVSGVSVTFAVTAGSGTLSAAAAATDGDGRASATLTLGRTTGANTVTATVATLPPLTFTAAGQTGPAAVLTKMAGDNQQGRAGMAVAVPPSVEVADAFGNPVAGATVTFAVASGGGSVNVPTATTGATGRAAVGSWVLGAGTNTLTATVAGVGGVTFTATAAATADPCATATPFTLRTTVAGTLAAGDCRLSGGEYLDFYRTVLSAAQAEEITLTSGAFDTFVYLLSASGHLLAFNDDGFDASSGNSAMRVYAPAGEYFVAASSYNAGATGAYQLSSRAMTARTGCVEQGWIVPGVSLGGTLASGDCSTSSGSRIDFYPVMLRAGQRLTVTMRSAAFDSYLVLLKGDAAQVSSNDDGAGGLDARIVYTAPADDVYYIGANTVGVSGAGTYTLSVTSP